MHVLYNCLWGDREWVAAEAPQSQARSHHGIVYKWEGVFPWSCLWGRAVLYVDAMWIIMSTIWSTTTISNVFPNHDRKYYLLWLAHKLNRNVFIDPVVCLCHLVQIYHGYHTVFTREWNVDICEYHIILCYNSSATSSNTCLLNPVFVS